LLPAGFFFPLVDGVCSFFLLVIRAGCLTFFSSLHEFFLAATLEAFWVRFGNPLPFSVDYRWR